MKFKTNSSLALLSLSVLGVTAVNASILFSGYKTSDDGTGSVLFTGSGFSDVTSVQIRTEGGLESIPFSMESDAKADLVVPLHLSVINDIYYFLFESSDSIGVATAGEWDIYDSSATLGTGNKFNYIASGGNVTSGGGANTFYVKNGGVLTVTGGGGNVIFLEEGAVFTGFNGGGESELNYSIGAELNLDDSGGLNQIVEYQSISFSAPQVIPEPHTAAIFGLGVFLFVCLVRRSRCSN